MWLILTSTDDLRHPHVVPLGLEAHSTARLLPDVERRSSRMQVRAVLSTAWWKVAVSLEGEVDGNVTIAWTRRPSPFIFHGVDALCTSTSTVIGLMPKGSGHGDGLQHAGHRGHDCCRILKLAERAGSIGRWFSSVAIDAVGDRSVHHAGMEAAELVLVAGTVRWCFMSTAAAFSGSAAARAALQPSV